MPSRDRGVDAWPACGDCAARRVCRRFAFFQALALSAAQHGPGKKHSRRIALEPWQQALATRPRKSSYAAWSADILGLFTAALDALDIPWTRSTKYIVSIYRKAATARPDEFVGPKDRAVPLNGVHYTA